MGAGGEFDDDISSGGWIVQKNSADNTHSEVENDTLQDLLHNDLSHGSDLKEGELGDGFISGMFSALARSHQIEATFITTHRELTAWVPKN